MSTYSRRDNRRNRATVIFVFSAAILVGNWLLKEQEYLKTLEENIVFEDILTPKKIEEMTNSTKGSIYGISSNNKLAAFFRQQNKSKEYKGLYFCGGSAHPGGGVPLVTLSGKITSELINKYELQK